MPEAQILGEHKVSPVPVSGISKPAISWECQGNWQKGDLSTMVCDVRHETAFHFEKGFLENMYQVLPRERD